MVAATLNGASAHDPGEALMWPQTVRPSRPPGTSTRRISPTTSAVVPQTPRKLVTTSNVDFGPGKGVHVADLDVGRRVAVAGYRHEPRRGVDAGADGAAEPCQLERQAAATGHVEEPVAGVEAQPVVDGDVLAAIARLAQGGKVDRFPAPSFVHHRPVLRWRIGLAHTNPSFHVAVRQCHQA